MLFKVVKVDLNANLFRWNQENIWTIAVAVYRVDSISCGSMGSHTINNFSDERNSPFYLI